MRASWFSFLLFVWRLCAIKLQEGNRLRVWISDFSEVEGVGGSPYKHITMTGRAFSRLTGDSRSVSIPGQNYAGLFHKQGLTIYLGLIVDEGKEAQKRTKVSCLRELSGYISLAQATAGLRAEGLLSLHRRCTLRHIKNKGILASWLHTGLSSKHLSCNLKSLLLGGLQ